MSENKNLEHALKVCHTLPFNQKAELIKQLLRDSKLLLYLANFFDEEQMAKILQVIAERVAAQAR